MKSRNRTYTTAILQLDIRFLQRRCLLAAGTTATLRWDDVTTANITALGQVVRVTLRCDRVAITQELQIAQTRAGFGMRGWWLCPDCGGRCAVLFLREQLVCLDCAGFHYATQSATPRRRALLKANKLRALYGADPELPQRPRWMRQAKFEQKLQEAEALLVGAFPGGYW